MKLGFVFPGQGSQSVGMLSELARDHEVVGETFDSASRALGYDVWDLVANGPEDTLNQTERTQPAMLVAGVAVWRVWSARGGGRADLMAGHSLGEYTALVCAGALEFEAAVGLVRDRGRFMQQAVPVGEGAIAAILGLEDEQVITACQAAAQGEIVSAVNFNAPGQVAIAGHLRAVERAIAIARQAGAKRAIRLPLSVPVHCDLMKPATERLMTRLAETPVSPPSVPVLHNVDARAQSMPAYVRDSLVRQLYSPVRWTDCVRQMGEQGVSTLVELGPGRVLSGLARRIDPTLVALPVFDSESLEKALDQVRAAGQ